MTKKVFQAYSWIIHECRPSVACTSLKISLRNESPNWEVHVWRVLSRNEYIIRFKIFRVAEHLRSFSYFSKRGAGTNNIFLATLAIFQTSINVLILISPHISISLRQTELVWLPVYALQDINITRPEHSIESWRQLIRIRSPRARMKWIPSGTRITGSPSGATKSQSSRACLTFYVYAYTRISPS